MSQHGDAAGFGCPAFGHLASAYVDQELPRGELDRFGTHLPGCDACRLLCAQYRAIDIAAAPAYPRPAEAEWDAAWSAVSRTIRADRAEAARSPATGLLRALRGIWPGTPWAGPLAAAAAAAVLIGLTLALRQAWAPAGVPQGVTVARHQVPFASAATGAASASSGGHAADILSVTCQPGWEAVVWTIGGDDPSTVVQCRPVEI